MSLRCNLQPAGGYTLHNYVKYPPVQTQGPNGETDMRDNGGAYRDRTDDPLLAKQVLSQLS